MRLPYALQAVSDVAGDLAAGVTPLDALAALHPGGSVTGAPKQAALRMIRALEPGPRGAYCGALGLLEGGRSTFSLLIRTRSAPAAGGSTGWEAASSTIRTPIRSARSWRSSWGRFGAAPAPDPPGTSQRRGPVKVTPPGAPEYSRHG